MNKFTMSSVVKKSEDGLLLRDYLREHKQISKKALTDIKFKGGKIEVNEKEETVRYVVKEGDRVKVTFPNEEVSEWIKPADIPLSILYEDEHILVINKPPHLPTIPSRNDEEASLAGAVLHYYKQRKIGTTFHAVNRLDKNTSGVMLIAKHRHMHQLFSHMQRVHQIERTYVAIVQGMVEKDEGTIRAPIARKETSMIERAVSSLGQAAVTHYKVLERFESHTLISLSLETGRTHQIRVHLSHIGHPLAGDTLYGGDDKLINRHALHSSTILFYHPLAEKELQFTCPQATDFEKILSQLKNDFS